MTLNQLNPIIQSWIDSDEFVDSVISVAQEFAILSTAPLIEVTFGLILKKIKPEEFKTTLLTSLPPGKQNEAIVSKLVHASLLPIKDPLAESGIDISIIAPLNKESAISYTSPISTLAEEAAPESLIAPLDETIVFAPETPVSPISPESLTASSNETPVFPQPIASISDIPTKIAIIESGLASSDIAPTHPTETATTSSLDHSDAPMSPLSANKPVSINDPLSASAPFVIHKEKAVERTSEGPDHTKEFLRPLFYSKEIEKEDPPAFANLEFKPPENNDNKNS